MGRALDLIKENWEEGERPAKKEIQYNLDLKAKLHSLGRLSQENLFQAQERSTCTTEGLGSDIFH